ncbi:MAG TPA: hypothetical protein VK254_02120 [Candidatus Bathyarchaeia archaeon]|nr:hypothetical protein [Candidatus Bathyarchaeia archaeon]
MFPTLVSSVPSVMWTSRNFLSSRPSVTTAPLAESTARNAIGKDAEASAETEADSVAVAVEETGTNLPNKDSPDIASGLFF